MKVKTVKIEKSEDFKDSLDSDENNESFEESMDTSDIEENTSAPGQFVRKRPSDDDEAQPSKKKKLNKKNELYKAPTADELSQLRETENLFHSNLFRLQIEEILKEVGLKDKYKKQFDTWFSKLKENIESIPETKERDLTRKKPLRKLGLEIPDVDVPINQKGKYRFLKPSNISTIGSYPLNTAVGPNVIIDIMVEMPAAIFQKHDFQDYKYLRKRSIYLSYIAANLSPELIQQKKFLGEAWQPKLKIIPAGSLSKRVTVHLHIAAEKGSFKLGRFSPEKNCVRPNWLFNSGTDAIDAIDASTLPPTPHYNSQVLQDLTMSEINSRSLKMLKEYPNLRDGIILLKIWLFQRQPEKSNEGFNGHILTMYVIHLLHEKKLNTFMSSYQIVRNVWNNLVQTNWAEAGIAMNIDAQSRIAVYQKYYDCVFLDSTGYHNLAANITVNNYLWIRSEAEVAVSSLDNASIDSFQVLFMRRLPFYSTFDNFICIHDIEILENLSKTVSREKQIDFVVDKRTNVISLITKFLKKGLGQRVSQIYVKPEEYKEWEVSEKAPSKLSKIFIGFQLNPDFCFDIIDKGPEANAPAAAEFREFWGNKSELRRFQDGSICEAVVWTKQNTISAKRSITKQIVMFLLKTKLNISKEDYFYAGDQIDEYLKYRKTTLTKFSYGTGEEATLQALNVFNSLEKQLTSLTDLPLSITGVQGISPVFRYTDVFPPLATVYKPEENTTEGLRCLLIKEDGDAEPPKSAPAIEGVIQLCASGKWPDELEAVRMTKAAFHIQIAESVRQSFKLRAQGSKTHVDIYKDGLVFRLRVAHQREIGLLKQQKGDDGVIKYRDNEESIALENELFHLPKLNGALHGLHSQQPSFGPTCCLVKRWLNAHLLDNSHFPEIVVELLVASMYLSSDPYKPAQVPQTGFFRFLEFFARDSWSTDPVIVNFNGEMTREEVVSIENHFGTKREELPPLFISSPYDHVKSIWTVQNPSRLTLNRVGTLAKEVLKLVEKELFESSCIVWKPMFRGSTAAYDILIHLKENFNTRRMQAIELDDSVPRTTWHPYREHPKAKIPVIGFNPVERYLEELRTNYGALVLFFHDTYGGSVIGVLIKPAELIKKEFKVTTVNCRKIDNTGKLVLNVSAMIEDFSLLGRGLVKNIDVQSHHITLS